ncbi:MAG TPA: two-component system response regulator [Gemmatimonas aurantiaca]|uniref:Two-component response regulator n=2 Tax=Gemmatimonas aurantiaca TaxID=173480 RepID=C1A476_GEMAT|nr:HD domain-containing phosphohydrolase [Gemmatimonas aurantiaca]BAH38901.1 two-component response regulator [Gemmatimonas aurantiaca T-27]HCT57213.1 two-component system response regulator [Gemmatimonas aurantiaca]
MISTKDARPTLLLVDDESTNLQVLRHTLQDQYRLLFARDGHKALELARTDPPDLVLMDIMMPGLSGYDVCRALKQDAFTEHIPIIFVTALADAANEQLGLDLGAVDYISKPFNPHIVKARVRTHLSLVQANEVRLTRLQIVQSLGAAGEFKDSETGLHVIRMSHYTRVLATAAGYGSQMADELFHAAPMHDIGKIGVPDAILQKAGPLTDEERRVMQQHTVIGSRIIGEHATGLLRMAATIARSHHEKWDGTGYPDRLAGEAIPHIARVVAVADVFDALTSARPYKEAWTVEAALLFMQQERGSHFDPELVDAFCHCLPEISQIRACWADTEATAETLVPADSSAAA